MADLLTIVKNDWNSTNAYLGILKSFDVYPINALGRGILIKKSTDVEDDLDMGRAHRDLISEDVYDVTIAGISDSDLNARKEEFMRVCRDFTPDSTYESLEYEGGNYNTDRPDITLYSLRLFAKKSGKLYT